MLPSLIKEIADLYGIDCKDEDAIAEVLFQEITEEDKTWARAAIEKFLKDKKSFDVV